MKAHSLILFALVLGPALADIKPNPRPSGLPPRPAKPGTVPVVKTLLAVDFEATAEGKIPEGFTKSGAVAVTAETAHSGKHCLRMDPAKNGARWITKSGPEIAALGGQHWGRMYLKVALPAPVPTVPEGKKFAVIHSTMVEGKALSPLANDPILVRLCGTCTGPEGTVQYLYNVQPKSRPEFGKGTKYVHHFTDQWTLVEWFVDYGSQTYKLFLDGQEITDAGVSKGAGEFAGAEIPAVFESLSFGWNNYQPAGEGFTAWIDDIALAKERLGGQP